MVVNRRGPGERDDDDDHQDRTGENQAQRLNRQLAELLQEMRVVQVGVQILFAFLLAIPFQQSFEHIGSAERTLYTIAVVCSALAMIFLMTPVALHRAWFQERMKDKIVGYATWMTGAGLGLLGPGVIAAVLLVLSVVINWLAAIITAAVLTIALVALWVVLPQVGRRGR